LTEAKATLKVPDDFVSLLTDVRLLKSDGNNPNRMTLRMHEELWQSLLKHGWVYPILTDQNLCFIDGEQRAQVCLAHGEYFVPVLRLNVSDVERRMGRQRFNKLKGKHSRDLDREEYLRVAKAGEREALERMLNAVGERLPGGMIEDNGGGISVPELYEVVIECKDEADQKAKFERFRAEGERVRILTL